MTTVPATPAARNPLDICIDDAVSHSGVLMAELVARARKSLYEVAHRSGQSENAALAAQARQALGDKATFFEDEFPAALLAAMRYPQAADDVLHDPFYRAAQEALRQPLDEFNALASAAVGLTVVDPQANPLSPVRAVQAIQAIADRTGVNAAVNGLWMQHLCLALGPELGAEYRRLSSVLRDYAVTPIPTAASAAVEAVALMTSAGKPDDAAAMPVQVHSQAAQRIAADIAEWPEIRNVPEVVRDFVLGPWSEVIARAEAHAGNTGTGTPLDPDGYLALVRPLFWSAQPALGRADNSRLMVTVPSLMSRLRAGLQSIGYPAEQSATFFRALDDLHGIAARAAGSSFAPRREPRSLPSASDGLLPEPPPASLMRVDGSQMPVAKRVVSAAAASQILQPGVQLAAWEGGRWMRWELTWASPKGKLLMFTTEEGDTDTMSRAGCIRRIVEQRLHIIPDIGF